MKKFIAIIMAIALLGTAALTLAAESILPWEGETLRIKAFAFDVGVTEIPDGKGTQIIQNYLGNVEIEWELPPGSDYDAKVALYFNSGDLPDLIWVRAASIFSTYGDSGLLWDYNKSMDVMPNFVAIDENESAITRRFTNSSGELVLFPDLQNDFVGEGWYANKTLLDQYNIAIPTNFDELVAACQALVDADPNITPFHTFWGLGYYKGIFSDLLDVRYGEYWDFDAGEYKHVLLDPEGSGYKDLIFTLAEFYDKGFFNPEFITMAAVGDDETKALISTSNWGFTYTYHGQVDGWYGLTDPLKETLPIECVPLLPPAPSGTTSRLSVAYVRDNPGWAYGVSAATANPDLVCAVVDSVYSDTVASVLDWGVEGFSYEYDENGEKQWIQSFLEMGPDAQKDAGIWNVLLPRYVRTADNRSQLTKNFADSKALLRLYTPAIEDGTLNAQYAPFPPMFNDEQRDERAAIMTPVNTVVNEAEMKFIIGDRSLSEWDQFIEEALNAGDVARYVEISNEVGPAGMRATSAERNYLVP